MMTYILLYGKSFMKSNKTLYYMILILIIKVEIKSYKNSKVDSCWN